MALIGNNADTLLNGLSAFWHRFFRDIKDLQAAYEGTEMLLGQVYLNFLSDVLNTSIVEAPLFRKEFYKLITIREDQLVFHEQGNINGTPPLPTFYGNLGTDRYVYTSDTFFNDIPQLQDTLFAPKATLETGLDYRVAGGELQFKIDPTNPILNGFAHRRVTIAIGGKFTSTTTTNWIAAGVEKGDTLYFSEAVDLGVGSLLNVQDTARSATIVHVTAEHLTVSIDTPFPTFPAGAEPTGFSWRVMRKRDDGVYNPSLPRSLGGAAPYTDGQIAKVNGVGYTTLEVSELAFWAVDSKVDDLTLYKTYGYFFTKQQLSTEAYRSLIRGLMQLYILGPALARLESALNLTAGLSTIREDGEILQGYDSGVLDAGTTGALIGNDIFQVPTSIFAQSSVGGYIKISDSTSSNNVGTFNIIEYVGPTQVVLKPVLPFTVDTNLKWLYTRTNKQTVTTSANVYTYPLETPMRDDVKVPANVGVLTFQAFETVTTAIIVTDYVQDPEWWHSITIPKEFLPETPIDRRVVTPQLYPNILGPAGNANVGDPGFYIGRDEDSGNLNQGSTGILSVGNQFDVDTDTFSLTSVGEYVEIYSATNPVNVGTFKILTYVNPRRVILIPSGPFIPEALLSWGYFEGHLAVKPYRHNAAFILMDRFLKLHMFAVLVDSSVTLTTILVSDLQKILKDVKPVHTALYFRPLTSFKDTIDLTDYALIIKMLRRSDDEITALENEWYVGSSWLIGDTWKFTNPVGGAITTNPMSGGIYVCVGGSDPSIQPADPTNIPPGGNPDLSWLDRALYVYTHL